MAGVGTGVLQRDGTPRRGTEEMRLRRPIARARCRRLPWRSHDLLERLIDSPLPAAARGAEVREHLAGEPQGHLLPDGRLLRLGSTDRRSGGSTSAAGRKPRRSSRVNSRTTPDLSVSARPSAVGDKAIEPEGTRVRLEAV